MGRAVLATEVRAELDAEWEKRTPDMERIKALREQLARARRDNGHGGHLRPLAGRPPKRWP